MVVKRVSVDRYTNEFNEEPSPSVSDAPDSFARTQPDFTIGMGEVRKYVHDLRAQ